MLVSRINSIFILFGLAIILLLIGLWIQYKFMNYSKERSW